MRPVTIRSPRTLRRIRRSPWPHPLPLLMVAWKRAAAYDTVSCRASPWLRPAIRRDRLRNPANALSRREPRRELLQTPAHADAQWFPGRCTPRLQKVRHPPDICVLVPNGKVSVYLVDVLHFSSSLCLPRTTRANNSGLTRRACGGPRVPSQPGKKPKHRGKPSRDSLLQRRPGAAGHEKGQDDERAAWDKHLDGKETSNHLRNRKRAAHGSHSPLPSFTV